MLSDNFIAKIEGHGSLTIDWEREKVRLNIHEGERLFEGLLVNRTAEEMHWITPRICGVCPVAHNLASLNALENAFGIKPSKSTILLRDLMQCGQMIQSHVLHLFFLVAPDYIGIDRATELNKKNPVLFKRALSLKKVSDEIVQLVGGRNVHPTRTTIGGFHKVPTKLELNDLLKKLTKTKNAANKTVTFFSSLDYPKLKVGLKLVCQYKKRIISKNDSSLIKDYKQDIQEKVKKYSTAKFSKYKKQDFFVGSLARLALLKDFKNYNYNLDFENPFYNNFAQAIEILHYHEKAINIIEKLLKTKINNKIIKPSKSARLKGIGSIEAPRGGLYHEAHLRKNNTIKYANIITPTAQNLTSIEKSAQALLEQTTNLSKRKREKLLVMLIRAYDPCITCSVH